MQTNQQTLIQERAEIVQDVIDRLLYLDPEQLVKYKISLEAINSRFPVDVRKENGVRFYNQLTKK
jgi:hypothetical protein